MVTGAKIPILSLSLNGNWSGVFFWHFLCKNISSCLSYRVLPPVETGKCEAWEMVRGSTGARGTFKPTKRVRGPTLCALSPAELLYILKTVSFIQCKCGVETAALCLRWMDPDSITTSVWKPMSGLNGFPLLISSSISISVLALPLSSYPTLHLSLCCSHFSSTTVTRQQSPFQPFSPFFTLSSIFLSALFLYFSFSLVHWISRRGHWDTVENEGRESDCNDRKKREREKPAGWMHHLLSWQ